jgi:hypothetical protein
VERFFFVDILSKIITLIPMKSTIKSNPVQKRTSVKIADLVIGNLYEFHYSRSETKVVVLVTMHPNYSDSRKVFQLTELNNSCGSTPYVWNVEVIAGEDDQFSGKFFPFTKTLVLSN